MVSMNDSRRNFLKIGSLLLVGVVLTPVMAVTPKNDVKQISKLSNRSDVRSLDFDSHNFLLNFRD
ncbi:hypothetical protein GCM10023338_14780 [Wohlfahrtiimonas larvae]|uniref:Twin-arginine translocation signal domain-containing protein n=2 Tax=Wohlfahrtiimonas larvae TaxID=1157986 RepID=A0ABP9MQK7_9GAMM